MEIGDNENHGNNNGHNIIELLCQADGLLRDELKTKCDEGRSLDIQYLLEARLNVSRALEALYDRTSDNCTF
jgi:hypothetical protein